MATTDTVSTGNVTPPAPDVAAQASPPSHVDVLVVGAGISGIGAAHHLLEQRPGTSFTIVEAQSGFGGTWRTHRYPGIRSDSDLFTFGYRFKPWEGAPIATAEEIMKYLTEVVADDGIDRFIHYDRRITDASWSGENAAWTVQIVHTDPATGEETTETVTCGFLWMCQGYYDHDRPYTPTWEGFDDFAGEVIHPQKWPEGTDLSGKRVVVIGSGATAATLIPNIAEQCGHVTMLQRSPTYFRAARNADDLVDQLRALDVPSEWIHEIARRKRVADGQLFADLARSHPAEVTEELFKGIREIMGDDYDMSPHFTPEYRPWRQRVAFVPDGDLFHAFKSGKASVVTDHIERFDADGIQLRSGERLDADVIITATGFDLSVLGGIDFEVDGEPMAFHDTVTWRGAMFTGVPNMVWVFGYFRASWTLRVDILADFVCRLLDHMDAGGHSTVVPALSDADADMALGPWVDPDDFNPGYLTRSMHLMPQQGDRQPWRHTQEYVQDRETLAAADLDDGLTYS